MAVIRIEVPTATLKRLVLNYLIRECNFEFDDLDVVIEVKTSQNYKAEWEAGEFRAILHKVTAE